MKVEKVSVPLNEGMYVAGYEYGRKGAYPAPLTDYHEFLVGWTDGYGDFLSDVTREDPPAEVPSKSVCVHNSKHRVTEWFLGKQYARCASCGADLGML